MRSKSPSPALSVGWVIPSQLLAQGRTSHNMHDQCPHSCQCHCRASSGLMLASDITNLNALCHRPQWWHQWMTYPGGTQGGLWYRTVSENTAGKPVFPLIFLKTNSSHSFHLNKNSKNIIRVDFHTNILEYNCVQAFPREAFPGKAVLFQLL